MSNEEDSYILNHDSTSEVVGPILSPWVLGSPQIQYSNIVVTYSGSGMAITPGGVDWWPIKKLVKKKDCECCKDTNIMDLFDE